MTFINHQPSMAAGEIGPELYGRVDQELYYIALRTARNMIIRQYGGASNRAGKKMTNECRYPDKLVRLIPFQFNEEQTYCLQFGDEYMRVIKDGAEVLETAKVITAITAANPAVVTSAGHGLSNGDDVYLAGIVGMVELNGRTVRIKNVAANTFELTDFLGNNINSAAYGAYTSGGTASRVYTLTTPWQDTDLFDLSDNDCLNYAQSNDVLSVVHADYYPRDITRTGHAAWTIGVLANEEGPFEEINTGATTVYASAATGLVTLTASASLFTNDMEGDLFYIEQEPTDTTKKWEVNVGIQDAEIRRAGSHYYQAPTHAVSFNISAVTAASPGVVTVTAPHSFVNDDVIYISGIVGMVELNGKFFKVRVRTSTTFSLLRLDGVDFSTTGFTAWSSGGTTAKAHYTGTVRPDHIEGSAKDGDPGVTWTYLHSGFGVVRINTYSSGTSATADVIRRLPTNVVGAGGATDIWAKAAWSVEEGYPSAVAYHKQRFILGGTVNQPNVLWFSGVGLRAYFGESRPILDDDSLTIALNTTGANAIRHLLPFSELISLTSASEHLINGVDDAILATELPFAKVQGYTGASRVPPIVINNTALFAQDMGSVIRSLQYQLDTDSFGGIDLTARSPHLFQYKKLIDWSYARHPLSVIWAVMDDGSLNGFTFMEEQKVYAWHRHDTQGEYESVCCIREGNETASYFVVKRTINGVDHRFVERMASRYFGTDVRDAYFLDCGLSYDGRNETATTVTISGGTTWDVPEELTLTASSGIFLATDVGNQINFRYEDSDGDTVVLRLTISVYTSATVVSATPTKPVPVGYQGVARTDWEFAKTRFRPFDHLEGLTVNALCDGNVVTGLTVTNGQVTIPDPAAVVHIGLPYVSDLETLDMAQNTKSGNTKTEPVMINRVFITAQESRSIFVSTNGLNPDDTATDIDGRNIPEVKQRTPSMGYDTAIPAQTQVFEVLTSSNWSRNARVAIRQVNPLPITVNCITPEMTYGRR